MIEISYGVMIAFISIIWCLTRAIFAIKNKGISLKREAQLLLVYVCIVVVVRFTFFPFSKVNGSIQHLILDGAQIYPFRINLIPFVNLFDYPTAKYMALNIIGNTLMFVPLGIIWPNVFKWLNTHTKVVLSGVCTSLIIEILQLPFYSRVSDVDDLILNSLGFVIGYLIYILACRIKKRAK